MCICPFTQAKLPPDSTVVPIILYMDATKVTHFGPDVQAHPIILTLGNIVKVLLQLSACRFRR